MYNVGSFKLLKLLGNTVVMGTVSAPGTIALDHSNNKLAVVGPLAHTITIMDPENLNEVSVGINLYVVYTMKWPDYKRVYSIQFFVCRKVTEPQG